MSASGHDHVHALLDHYRETREPEDLFAAFGAAKEALSETSPQSPEYVDRVRALAEVMFVYFDFTGGFSVIDCAVEMLRRESSITGAGDQSRTWALRHPDWQGGTFSRALGDPAWTLHHPDGRRSQIWKDWTAWNGNDWPMGWQVRRPDGVVIELGEDQWGDSWQLDQSDAPPEAAAGPASTSTEELIGQADALREQFLQTGDRAVLEEAIRIARTAVDRTQDGGPLRPVALGVAANLAQDWFRVTGDLNVLYNAAGYARQAVEDPAALPVNRGTALNTLAGVHQNLYAATQDRQELAEAIRIGREAVAAAGPAWTMSAINLVSALDDWYELTEERRALEEALELCRRVLDETPEGHPRRPGRLNTYGNILTSWLQETGDLDVLDQVIAVRREAQRLADPDEVDYPSILNNLGNAVHAKARMQGDRDALREAVELRREAAARTPRGSVARIAHLRNLVTVLEEWREATGDAGVDDEIRAATWEIEGPPPGQMDRI